MNHSIALGVSTSEVAMPLKGYFDYLLSKDGEKFLKANEQYHEAKSLYLAGEYGAALPHLQEVNTLLGEPQSETTAELKFSNSLISVASLSAIIILVILLLVQTKKKRLSSARGRAQQ